MSLPDWVDMANGFKDSLDRWKKRGCPGPRKDAHIELCRKEILDNSDSDEILINLNQNLYKLNEGKIFAEGSEINDDKYIHLKIRDIRVELTIDDFKELSSATAEAYKRLEDSNMCSGV